MTKPNEASNKPSRPRVALAQRRKARRLIVQAMYQWLLAPVDVIEIEAQFRAEHTGKVDWDYFHDVFPSFFGHVFHFANCPACHFAEKPAATQPEPGVPRRCKDAA